MGDGMSMVEKVARAISIAMTDKRGQPAAVSSDVARAAIEAMREPTDVVLSRGRSVEVAGDEGNRAIGWLADNVWKAMINEALK